MHLHPLVRKGPVHDAKKLHCFASYVSRHSSFKSGLINVFAKSTLTCNSWLIFACEVTGLFSWHGNKATRPLVETASRQAGLGEKVWTCCGLRATWQTTEPQKSWQSLCFPVCFFKVLQGGINPSDKWGFNAAEAEWFSRTAPRAPGWVDGSRPACMDRITRAPSAVTESCRAQICRWSWTLETGCCSAAAGRRV